MRPSDSGYWREPDLTWGVQPEFNKEPAKVKGEYVFQMPDNSMAPRFPLGTVVMLWKVPTRANLVIGKPYVYSYADTETGELLHQVGRLEHIGEDALTARADNAPAALLVWPIDREKGFDMVRVIDAYVTYPPDLLGQLPMAY